jgi:hypothetical protein
MNSKGVNMIFLRSLALIGSLLATSLLPNETLAEEQNAYIVLHEEPVAQRVIKMKLTFTSQFTERTVTDLGAQGSTAGDGIHAHGVLQDLSGKEIGRFDTNHTLTEPGEAGEMRMVLAEYAFGDGRDSLLIAGAELFQTSFGVVAEQRDLLYGVLAGTGKFAGARGECHVKRSSKVQYMVNCVLFVPEF